MYKTVLGHYSNNKLTCSTGIILHVAPYNHDRDKIENQYGFFLLSTFNKENIETAKSFCVKNFLIITEEEYNIFKTKKGGT